MVQPQARIRVYTDGRCGLCLWSRRFVERYDVERRVDFRDYNEPAIAREAPYPLSELAREMHVDAAGSWFAGYRAWVEVLKALPRWRWLARIGLLPPLRWFGPSLYRVCAANRYRIARWLGAPTVECGWSAGSRQTIRLPW